jgi:hypothetical protein
MHIEFYNRSSLVKQLSHCALYSKKNIEQHQAHRDSHLCHQTCSVIMVCGPTLDGRKYVEYR